MTLNYAIIGCGRISPNHIAAALENELNIVALCDLDNSKMESTKNSFNLDDKVKFYTDYHEMLKNESIHLIGICTESGEHGKIALECIEAGVNLII